MRPYFLVFLILIICSCGENQKPVADKPRSSRFSSEFNGGFLNWMNDYYKLSELFVNWDSASVGPAAMGMIKTMDNLVFDEKDSVVKNKFSTIKEKLDHELYEIGRPQQSLETKRKAFSNFSEKLYTYLQDIKYDAAKIYLHECTMPFNDTGRAVWLSKTDSIRNPFLGIHHPRYGSGMLECGTHEATIDYIAD